MFQIFERLLTKLNIHIKGTKLVTLIKNNIRKNKNFSQTHTMFKSPSEERKEERMRKRELRKMNGKIDRTQHKVQIALDVHDEDMV